MPIKPFKGFQRRKSSGNALEDGQFSEPSFRVMTRPSSPGKSFEAQRAINQQLSGPPPPMKNNFDHHGDNLFSVARPDPPNRGSGGTEHSSSTVPYDSATSSRHSTSSTNPSSVDVRSDKNAHAQRGYTEPPPPAPPAHRASFLKTAGRTFSFGVSRPSKDSNDFVLSERSRPAVNQSARDRATTISSVTTATAPRLEDSHLAFDNSELDSFGNMFDGIGTKNTRDTSPHRPHGTYTVMSAAASQRAGQTRPVRAPAPQPILLNTTDDIESSPYSHTSSTSHDGLMRSPSPSRTVTQNSPQLNNTIRNVEASNGTTTARNQVESTGEDNMFETASLRKRAESRPSTTQPHTSTRAPPSSFPVSMGHGRALPSIPANSPSASTRGHDRSLSDVPDLDPALLASADLAARYEESKPMPSPARAPHKVMTPAEFERYKQHKEETRRYNKVFGKQDSEEESGDDYEDDDEEEQVQRERQATQQRKKQEAHLAVYRQTMMKVTGDAPTGPPRPGTGLSNFQAGNSSSLDVSNLNGRMSHLTVDGKRSHTSTDEDEDEDVPLGILAAHGFPNKNRPPTKLNASSSNPNLRSLAQMQPGGGAGSGSVAGDASRRGSLPPFARGLPTDPYYGASIHNPAVREPLAIHSSANLAVPSGASTSHPMHPAGLVGVIAGEERARAMRRGSPNAQGNYDMPPSQPPSHPGMARSHTMGGMPNVVHPGMPGMPPMPGMLSPGDQAQIQMSQQMTQMMQMQMQWMQQMTQMTQMMGPPNTAGMPPSMPPNVMPNAMPMPMGPPPRTDSPHLPPFGRPQSVPLQSYGNADRRTMSTLNNGMAPWHNSTPAIPQLRVMNGGGYAPSIAPSERSNVGMAPRYRAVSSLQPEPDNQWQKRSSTFTSSTFRPWPPTENNQMHVTNNVTNRLPMLPTVRKVNGASGGPGEDDDDQAWVEMKAKKEKKQKSWKLRKGQNTLQELYNTPA